MIFPISNYSDATGSHGFILKTKQITLIVFLRIKITLKLFKYKSKLIGTLEAAGGILENATISVPLIYLSNFVDYLKCHCLIAK